MIDLYIFDEGGVLIRNHMVLGGVAAALGMERDALFALLPPELSLVSNGEIGSEEFWRRFEARTGIRAEKNWWSECFKPTRDEPTFSLVRELAMKARIVCGTNTIDCHHIINESLGMYEPFHAVYASHLMHLSKPDPRFWEKILADEGVAPERAFFTDDSPKNVEAARELGIQAFLYTDADSLRRDLLSVGAAL
ncbi:MAG: haloacid dehalogenase [Spirochaetae bacterium HGW-Spirochaetae-9]|nr:MAG: haloacid dehalogenase [Spirochaetae bacterium HGW-Spirochaetae-9]